MGQFPISRLHGTWLCNLSSCDVDNSVRQAYKCAAIPASYIPMLHTRCLLKFLVYAALFCTVATIHAWQGTGATQSPASAGVATAPSSDSALFEVAPGIPLPLKGIVWVLDTTEDKPELLRVSLSNASFNRHIGENIARSQFFLKSVATLELPDAAAKLRISSRTPVIYVRRSAEEEEEFQSASTGAVKVHYVLLRIRVVDGRRVIYGFSAAPFGKYVRQKEDEVEVISQEFAAGQWLKITPKQPLPDGEYAVNRMPDDRKLAETFVYDFGIGIPATQPPQK
jgi:hypothetical protein